LAVFFFVIRPSATVSNGIHRADVNSLQPQLKRKPPKWHLENIEKAKNPGEQPSRQES